MIPQVDLFSFVFFEEIEDTKNLFSKLTDLLGVQSKKVESDKEL